MRRRRFPPAFDRQKVVSVDVEWKSPPVRGAKAIIVRQCALGGVAGRAERGLRGENKIVRRSGDRLLCQFSPLAGQERKMHPPVEKSSSQRGRRYAQRRPGNGCLRRTVENPERGVGRRFPNHGPFGCGFARSRHYSVTRTDEGDRRHDHLHYTSLGRLRAVAATAFDQRTVGQQVGGRLHELLGIGEKMLAVFRHHFKAPADHTPGKSPSRPGWNALPSIWMQARTQDLLPLGRDRTSDGSSLGAFSTSSF